MTHLLIGSQAAKRHFPDWREPKDYDVFSTEDYPGVDTFWHPKFSEWLPAETSRVATPDELLTIKVSHAYWELDNGTWDKHMHDILALKARGAVTIDWLHDLLYDVWTERHGAKRVDLTMDKQSFFDDAVRRRYDHDSVHYSVAYGDRPLYETVMKDGASVQTDMRKVKALPYGECVRLYREEIYATALERWVIPSDYTCSPRWAYARALRKTIVSLTKGWSSRFLVDNYGEFRRPDIDYVQHHLSKKHLLIPMEV